MDMKSLKSLLILFSKTVSFSYIHTDLLIGTVFLYSYRSPNIVSRVRTDPLYQYCFLYSY